MVALKCAATGVSRLGDFLLYVNGAEKFKFIESDIKILGSILSELGSMLCCHHRHHKKGEYYLIYVVCEILDNIFSSSDTKSAIEKLANFVNRLQKKIFWAQ